MKCIIKRAAPCCLVFLLIIVVSAFASSPEQAFRQSEREYICSWISLASYPDRIGTVAQDELRQYGWDIKPMTEKNAQTDAKFTLAVKQDAAGKKTTIVAISGTSSMQDVKSDLNMHAIPFHEEDQGSQVVPLVHAGFNKYANTVLNHSYENKTIQEALQATVSQSNSLILTGHSLGGAVAVLIGARLLDSGLLPNQLQVLTFGAPAVGNSAFNTAYEKSLQLDRIVIQGDPVKNILQAVYGTYEQFNEKTQWKQNKNTQRFHHDMVVYVDAALRNYYDKKKAYEAFLGYKVPMDIIPEHTSNLYVMPATFELDNAIASDKFYMIQAADDYLRYHIGGIIFGKTETVLLDDGIRRARQANCDYVLLRRYKGERMRDANYDFCISLEEEIYDVQGNFITSRQCMTHTTEMTPIEAVLYVTAMSSRK